MENNARIYRNLWVLKENARIGYLSLKSNLHERSTLLNKRPSLIQEQELNQAWTLYQKAVSALDSFILDL